MPCINIVREADFFSGAPLGLWINDLGAADPYYILPAVTGLMVFLGTKNSVNTATQMPVWITYLLPIISIVFLWNQPAGLALYIMVGSVFQAGVNFVAVKVGK